MRHVKNEQRERARASSNRTTHLEYIVTRHGNQRMQLVSICFVVPGLEVTGLVAATSVRGTVETRTPFSVRRLGAIPYLFYRNDISLLAYFHKSPLSHRRRSLEKGIQPHHNQP